MVESDIASSDVSSNAAIYPCRSKAREHWCDRHGQGGFMGHTCIAPKTLEDKVVHDYWRGIGKLTEECGEVLQLLGKLIPFPDGMHPDGKGNLSGRLADEIADLYAALDYFVEFNDLPQDSIRARREQKLDQFERWGLTGIARGRTDTTA
jgi:NTP pyrophosphatase (non-canonical NTP hydrolase)